MNKAIIPVLILVLTVAGISGCTDSTLANKTYSANGITFVYPGSWSELNKTAYQSEVNNNTEILFVVGNNQTHLTLGKFVLGSNQVLYTLREWAQAQNSSMPSSMYLSEKTLTIAGVDAYQLRYRYTNGDYVTAMYFIKNNTGYLMAYVSRYEETETLENIIKSFKMP